MALSGIASLRARAVFLLTCLASVSLVRVSSEIGNYALALLLVAWGRCSRSGLRPAQAAKRSFCCSAWAITC